MDTTILFEASMELQKEGMFGPRVRGNLPEISKKKSLQIRWKVSKLKIICILACSLASACLRGPAFMNSKEPSQKNFRQPEGTQAQIVETAGSSQKVSIPTVVEGAKASAVIDSKSPFVQVISASPNSSIAGSQIEFPPGALAIDTEITVQPGLQVATAKTLQGLAIETQVLTKATPIAITSTVAIDTEQPFSVALPLPQTSGLTGLESEDWNLTPLGLALPKEPLENLVVFFNVIVAAEGQTKQGIIPRSQIEIVEGYARILTRHFGTFQTAVLARKIESLVQVPAAPLGVPPDNAVAETPAPRRYYVKGAGSISSGQNQLIRTWIPISTPSRVSSLSSNFLSGLSSYPEP